MEPLQNITEEELKAMNFDGIIALTISRLGAAIDRINELSIDNKWLNEMLATLISDHSELEAKYEGHYHAIFVDPLGSMVTDGPTSQPQDTKGDNE